MAPTSYAQWRHRLLNGSAKQLVDLWTIERSDILEADEATLIAAALQDVVRIRQRLAIVKVKIDASGVHRQREHAVRRSFGRAESNCQRVVVVVNQLDSGGESFA